MKNDEENEKRGVADEPIVIADECGDSMWDTVLKQSPFVQALTKAQTAKTEVNKIPALSKSEEKLK